MAVIEAIQSVYLEAAAASVTFSSLGSYEHLQIRTSGRHTSSGGGGSSVYIRFNSDTTGYETHSMQAYSGSNTNADRYADQGYVYSGGRILGPLTPSSENYGVSVVDIRDYRNANKHTTMTQMGGTVGDYQGASFIQWSASLWEDTSAVTSILMYPPSGSFERGTSITLYGLNSS